MWCKLKRLLLRTHTRCMCNLNQQCALYSVAGCIYIYTHMDAVCSTFNIKKAAMIQCFVQWNFKVVQSHLFNSSTEIRVYSCTCCDGGRRYNFVLTSQLADPLTPFCPGNRKFPAKDLNTYHLLPNKSLGGPLASLYKGSEGHLSFVS